MVRFMLIFVYCCQGSERLIEHLNRNKIAASMEYKSIFLFQGEEIHRRDCTAYVIYLGIFGRQRVLLGHEVRFFHDGQVKW